MNSGYKLGWLHWTLSNVTGLPHSSFVTTLIAGHLTWRNISTASDNNKSLLLLSLSWCFHCSNYDCVTEAWQLSWQVWGAGGGCLWSQCSLTDHLLITRDWAPVSSAHSSLDALRPRLLRSERACRFWSRAQAPHCALHRLETQQTGLFQLRRDGAALLWVTTVLRPRHEDRQRRPSWHLAPSVIVGMTDEGRILSTIILQKPPQTIYQSFKPEHGAIVSKKLSTLGTESIHLDTHARRDLSDLTSHNVTCQLIPLSLYFMRSMMMMVNWILTQTRDITPRSGNTMLFSHKKVQQNVSGSQFIVLVATSAGAGGRKEKLLNLTTQRVNSLAQMLCKRWCQARLVDASVLHIWFGIVGERVGKMYWVQIQRSKCYCH